MLSYNLASKTACFAILAIFSAKAFAQSEEYTYLSFERHAIISLVNFQSILQLDENYNVVEKDIQPVENVEPVIPAESVILPPSDNVVQTNELRPAPDINTLAPDYHSTKKHLEQIISIDLSDITLVEAIDYIANQSQVSILTNWNELELMDVNRDDIVNLTLIDAISASKALNIILQYL